MWSALQCVGGFINRNRTKIAVATVIAVGVTLYLTYNNTDSEDAQSTQQRENPPQTLQFADDSKAKRTANRTRLLFKVRRQFDSTAGQFLPIVRVRIVEVIDIGGTIKHIKELRARATTNKEELEARLWTEIKDSSFALLITTAYMLCAVCVLLRIQLHVLARSLQRAYEADGEEQELQLNGDMFRTLIDGTYRHLFGAGLQALAAQVNAQVSTTLADWSVKDKLHVEYDELVHALNTVRQALDADMGNLVKTILLPAATTAGQSQNTVVVEANGHPAAATAAQHGTYAASTNSIASGSVSVAQAGTAATVQNLLDQTWDLLESPAFHTVYTEALNRCFQHIHSELYRTIFFPEARSPGQHALRAPPLASLLPQTKAIATKLLPGESEAVGGSAVGANGGTTVEISEEIRELVSGPYLDAFCMAVFDTPLR